MLSNAFNALEVTLQCPLNVLKCPFRYFLTLLGLLRQTFLGPLRPSEIPIGPFRYHQALLGHLRPSRSYKLP